MKVYYDTTCNFCKISIRPFKKNKQLEFCEAKSTKTIVVEKNGVKYIKSDAVIELLKSKSSLFTILQLFPKTIRDWMYDIVAKNRYRIKSKKERK